MLRERPQTCMDSDVLVSDLIQSWINGNQEYVIDKLSWDHPGLTAMMIVQGAQDKTLKLSDCNIIANRLIDRRIQAFQVSK